jgi:acetyl-CoA acetyltransferase
MNDIYIVGVGMTQFGRLLDNTVYDMVNKAVGLALNDAGCATGDIGSAYYATMTNGLFQGQTAIPGPIAMRRLGIESIPVFTVENACASGSSAFNLATLALRAGSCDIALAVGVEKMNIPDKAKMFTAFDGGWDVSTVEHHHRAPSPNVRTASSWMFMPPYAAITCSVMVRRNARSPRSPQKITSILCTTRYPNFANHSALTRCWHQRQFAIR